MTPLEIQSHTDKRIRISQKDRIPQRRLGLSGFGVHDQRRRSEDRIHQRGKRNAQDTSIGSGLQILIGVIGDVLGGKPTMTNQSVEQTVATAFIEEIKAT